MKNKYTIGLVSFCIFSILLFFTLPHYNISMETNLNNEESCSVQYSNSSEKLPSLNDYHIMKSRVSASIDGEIDIKNIPILVDNYTFSFPQVSELDVYEVKISLGDIPLKLYRNIELAERMSTSSEMVNASGGVKFANENGIVFTFRGISFWKVIVYGGLVLAGVSILLGYIITKKISQISNTLTPLLLITSPMLVYSLFEILVDNFFFITIRHRLANYSVVLTVYVLMYMVIHRPVLCINICNFGGYFIGIINYFVLLFRGKPILPWDFGAISTALSVAQGYKFSITFIMVMGALLLLVQMILMFVNKTYLTKTHRSKKDIVLVISIIVLPLACFHSKIFQELQCLYWDTDIVFTYRTNGSILSFCKYILDSKIEKPENYNPQILDIVDEAISQEDKKSTIQAKNIIVIMNESFTDFEKLGYSYEEEAVLPYFNKLAQEAIYGNLYVSVRGGSTCNTEFEVLTGNSLVFLPPGSFPFQNYINKNTFSIAQYLRSLGYKTLGIHLEQGRNWNRNNVYPRLGFEKFYDINKFENIETLRGRATDNYNYEKVIELYENHKDSKLFIFNTTIQNHGGYTGFYDLPQLVDISPDSVYENAEVFLSLIKLSDEAIENLVEYFKKVDSPTMIVIFGDHQPQLNEVSENYLLEEEPRKANYNNLQKYITPFLIWRNYDCESQYVEKISANYLSSIILDKANIELPAYNRFLLKLYEEFPVITLQGIEDKNGKFYSNINEISDNEWLYAYESLQYYSLFDSNEN